MKAFAVEFGESEGLQFFRASGAESWCLQATDSELYQLEAHRAPLQDKVRKASQIFSEFRLRPSEVLCVWSQGFVGAVRFCGEPWARTSGQESCASSKHDAAKMMHAGWRWIMTGDEDGEEDKPQTPGWLVLCLFAWLVAWLIGA